jgi:hypothetical protein
MPPLEDYLRNADRLAQVVVNTWGQNTQVGNAHPLPPQSITPQFKELFDKACLYRIARKLADNRRKFNVLSEQEATEEMAIRLAFAEAYKAFYEKRAAAS